MGHDGCGCGDGHRAGGDGAACRVVSAAHEDHQARARRLCPAGAYLRADAGAGHYQLPVPDQSGRGHGGNQQYAPQIRGTGPGVRAGAVRSDPHGGGRHRDEVLPDRHIHRGRHGSGVHPHCGLQHGRGEKDACPGAVHQTADRRSAGGCGGAGAGRGLPPAADRHFRRGQ